MMQDKDIYLRKIIINSSNNIYISRMNSFSNKSSLQSGTFPSMNRVSICNR